MRKGMLIALAAGMAAMGAGSGTGMGFGDAPEPLKIDPEAELKRIQKNKERAKVKSGLTPFIFSNGDIRHCLNMKSAMKKAEKMGCRVIGEKINEQY